MHIEVYTDGSATTNDKPGGYGYVICIDGEKRSEGSGHMDNASNNDAELEAAIQGLDEARRRIAEIRTTIQINDILIKSQIKVTLVSDSQLILGWATGKYSFRQQDKMDKYTHLQLLVKIMNVDTRWVEGHSGDEHNERCDHLANQARLNLQKQAEKIEAISDSNKTAIGTKKIGVVCIWYKDSLKIIDLENNIVEDYNREKHGTRGGLLEIREDKAR